MQFQPFKPFATVELEPAPQECEPQEAVAQTRREQRIARMAHIREILANFHDANANQDSPADVLAAAAMMMPRRGFRRVLTVLRKQAAMSFNGNRAYRRHQARLAIHSGLVNARLA